MPMLMTLSHKDKTLALTHAHRHTHTHTQPHSPPFPFTVGRGARKRGGKREERTKEGGEGEVWQRQRLKNRGDREKGEQGPGESHLPH
jgi:hypothetical protein